MPGPLLLPFTLPERFEEWRKGFFPLRDLPVLPPDAGAGEVLPRGGLALAGNEGGGSRAIRWVRCRGGCPVMTLRLALRDPRGVECLADEGVVGRGSCLIEGRVQEGWEE